MQGERGARLEAPRPLQCGLQHQVGRRDLVHQAYRQGLVRADRASGEDQLLGLGRADQPGHPLGAAGSGDDAEQDLGESEPRLGAADPRVGGQGQLAAAAESGSVDRGHHRLGDGGHRVEGALEHGRVPDHLGVRHPGHLLDVGPRREGPGSAVDDHRADPFVGRGLFGGQPQRGLGRPVEHVERRPVQPEDAHRPVDVQPYRGVFQRGGGRHDHSRPPFTSSTWPLT